MTAPTVPRPRSRGTASFSFLLRLLLVPVVLGILLIVASTLVGRDSSAVSTLLGRVAAGAVVSVITVACVVGLARLRSRPTPRSETGRPPANLTTSQSVSVSVSRGRAFTAGFVLWAVPAVIMFGVLTLLGARWSLQSAVAEALPLIGLLFLAVLLSEAVPEELAFRGHVTDVLQERLGGWPVILVQAALFTAFALLLRGWTGLLDLSMFAGMGVAFGYLRMVAGSVWTSVGFHTAFQTGAQLLMAHEVVGLEASDTAVMVALGPVPFAVAATAVAVLVPLRPGWFGHRRG